MNNGKNYLLALTRNFCRTTIVIALFFFGQGDCKKTKKQKKLIYGDGCEESSEWRVIGKFVLIASFGLLLFCSSSEHQQGAMLQKKSTRRVTGKLCQVLGVEVKMELPSLE